MAEKGAAIASPDYVSSDSPRSDGAIPHHDVEGKHSHEAYGPGVLSHGGAVRDKNFYTRNGLNMESFKMRSYGEGIVELDRSMKKRHLSMIAIGKYCSIHMPPATVNKSRQLLTNMT
jgi:hypothetical protein